MADGPDALEAEYDRLRAKGTIPPDDEPVELTVVTLAEFAATEEAGAQPLLGDADDILIPANGDVMVYGDGGAGKTTLCVDLACHLAAGIAWLGIAVAKPLQRVARSRTKAPGPCSAARSPASSTPGPAGASATASASSRSRGPSSRSPRSPTAKRSPRPIAAHEIDLVIIGPLAAAGMNEAGTLQEVRAFIALCDDVRHARRPDVTFLLIHHENKGGKVSGAWEGAGDTLLHVQGMGHGRTRLHVQKARWSSHWHAQTLELEWTDGDGFVLNLKPEKSDDDLTAEVFAVINDHPGISWTDVSDAVTGVRAARKKAVRDRLLGAGRIVNVVRSDGRDVALDHCPERRPAHLHVANDPTIRHLRPDPDADGTQSASAGVRADQPSASLRPDIKRDAGWDADGEGAPNPPDPDSPSLLDTLAAELGATPDDTREEHHDHPQ